MWCSMLSLVMSYMISQCNITIMWYHRQNIVLCHRKPRGKSYMISHSFFHITVWYHRCIYDVTHVISHMISYMTSHHYEITCDITLLLAQAGLDPPPAWAAWLAASAASSSRAWSTNPSTPSSSPSPKPRRRRRQSMRRGRGRGRGREGGQQPQRACSTGAGEAQVTVQAPLGCVDAVT